MHANLVFVLRPQRQGATVGTCHQSATAGGEKGAHSITGVELAWNAIPAPHLPNLSSPTNCPLPPVTSHSATYLPRWELKQDTFPFL